MTGQARRNVNRYILPLAKFEQCVIIIGIEIVAVSLEAVIRVIYRTGKSIPYLSQRTGK
jgi:hypothetical protein